MFDDYDYKNTKKRIAVRFVQKRDEPMYPWEIAAFLKTLNTVYYKNELLNSICTCLNQGISADDIYVFNKSLPLYKTYTGMDLLDETQAASYWYHIGLPYPLRPNKRAYEHNLLYQAFNRVNSLLHSQSVRPMTTETISLAYELMRDAGLEAAEEHIIQTALSRVEKNATNSERRGTRRQSMSLDDISRSLEKYRKQKATLFDDISYLSALDQVESNALVSMSGGVSGRRASVLLAFFRNFNKTTRPLVCVRVAENKFRVLGRSLINKKERTGLEVKEVKRNSPLGALIEGGVAIYQAVQQEKRNKELHELAVKEKELEIEQKKIELAAAQSKLEVEHFRKIQAQLAVADQLEMIADGSDIRAIQAVKESFIKEQLMRAYGVQGAHAQTLLLRQGLNLDPDSITVVDAKV